MDHFAIGELSEGVFRKYFTGSWGKFIRISLTVIFIYKYFRTADIIFPAVRSSWKLYIPCKTENHDYSKIDFPPKYDKIVIEDGYGSVQRRLFVRELYVNHIRSLPSILWPIKTPRIVKFTPGTPLYWFETGLFINK